MFGLQAKLVFYYLLLLQYGFDDQISSETCHSEVLSIFFVYPLQQW